MDSSLLPLILALAIGIIKREIWRQVADVLTLGMDTIAVAEPMGGRQEMNFGNLFREFHLEKVKLNLKAV